MKILYLHQYFKFPDEQGGTRSYDLATSFVNKGYTVVVVTSTSSVQYKIAKRWHVEQREGLEIYRIYLPYGNHLSYLQRTLVFIKFLWFSTFKLLALKGDLLLATSTPLTIGVPALFKKWFGGTPFIFEVRDVWPEAVIAIGAIKNKLVQSLLYRLERLIYNNAAAIVPLSTDMKNSIINRYPNLQNKAKVVIENIAEITRFQNASDTKIFLDREVGFVPRFSILYAGTFGRVNGVEYVIRLAKETLKFDDKLIYILIGSGSEKEEIVKLAKSEGLLNRNVFIFAPVTKRELPAWYKVANMGSSFVVDVPELWANSANKFFDTLAARKPVLINHGGWQADRIREDNIGYVLPQIVTPEVAKQFVEYSLEEEKYQNQCERALKTAKNLYSLEVAVNKYLRIFKSIKNGV